MAVYRKGDDQFPLREKAAAQKADLDRNKIHNDSFNMAMVGKLEGGPTVETLMMRHKMLGEERPVSGAGLALGTKAAEDYLAKKGK